MQRSALGLLFAALSTLAAEAGAGVTIVHLSPLDLEDALVEGLAPVPFERGLLQGTGTLQSPVIEAAYPFDDLVASWNAEVPAGASIEVSAQARVDGRWTRWYRLARWTEDSPESFERQEDGDGLVDVDTLKLKLKADAFRYRVALASAGARKARLLRVAVAYEDSARKAAPATPFEPGPWVRELAVPPRSQMTEKPELRRDICSPASLGMLLQFWGRRLRTVEVAEAVRDRRAGVYGNWPLNVAAAAARGLAGQVARLPSLLELQDEIAAGRPVIVSVSFNKGELSGAPLERTRGHLFVVSGFTDKGDVIVRDPAAPDASGARRVYKREQFERAWLRNKLGLAYLLAERFPEELVVGVPTADLRARPSLPRASSPEDPGLSSQLLYGERVLALEARGEWVRVRALEQPHDGGRAGWAGYPGWVLASALRKPPLPYRANAVIRAKRAALVWTDAAGSEESLTLPLGASLLVEASSGSALRARLLNGRPARADAGAVRLLEPGAPIDRREVLEAAALFLGDRYVWGGRSSLQRQAGWGVDCSGLVQLAYRSAGMTLPRDAHHQHLRARKIRRSALKPGDLVFLTRSSRSSRVNHVLLYTGGDGLIESRLSAGKTLRTTFAERFGDPLTTINSGDSVPDITHRKSYRRRIFFGTFLEDR